MNMAPCSDPKPRPHNERGAALIAVIGLLALAALLAASMVTLSQTSAASSATNCELGYGGYAAESALARIQWLLLYDKQRYPERSLDFKPETAGVQKQEQRLRADGRSQQLTVGDCTVEFVILDAAGGFDVIAVNPAVSFVFYEKDSASREGFQALADQIQDYLDDDDFPRLHGSESADYLKRGMPGLPRNNACAYREEILWVPDAPKYFKPNKDGRMDIFRIIPPAGLPRMPPMQNFFSMPKELLKVIGFFSEEQLEKIIAARELWFKEGTPIANSLPADILGILRSRFAFRESSFYTIIVSARPANGGAQRTLVASFRLTNQLPPQGFQYYEWIRY